MTGSLTRTVAMLLVVALAVSGCENMSPETTGVVAGVLAGTAAGGIAKAAGASDSTAVAVGLGTGAAVGAMAYVIAKHQATERQRRIAENPAPLAYSRMSAESKAHVT